MVGGEPERLTTVDSDQDETDHWWPHVLPNGTGVLFTAWSGSDESSRIALMSLRSGEVTYLLSGGSNPIYSPTGHIVYGQSGTLWTVGFDADRLELTSETPVPVVENVRTKPRGAASFDLSQNGSLVYVSDDGTGQTASLVWVDRQGTAVPLDVEADAYRWARVSPDGTRSRQASTSYGRRSHG